MQAIQSKSAAPPGDAAAATNRTPSASGLEGVIAAETRLGEVDGERGHLVIAGHDVERLAGAVTFEDVVSLLAGGNVGDLALRAPSPSSPPPGRAVAKATRPSRPIPRSLTPPTTCA